MKKCKREEFHCEFKRAMVGVYSFATFLMDNIDVIEEFDADSATGYCHGYRNENGSYNLRYGFLSCNRFEQYSEDDVTNEEERLERLLKYGFPGCFDNTHCTTTVIHDELGRFEDYRRE